ncbi:MAG: peptide chain release factor 1 [Oscillospiraceae bacterium]|nr:peptide chain release factor 1 [Oscillospiraceae bacterium]
MFENLLMLQKQYEEIRERMERPEVYSDASAYSAYDKELREIEPIVNAYTLYLKAESDMDASMALFDDPELKELAKDEYRRAEEEHARLEDEIKVLLLPRDPNDSRNVIMEIRSGVGGEESALFAADLFRMYSIYAESKGWKIEVVNVNETELGGIREIDFIIEGEGAYSRLKYEAGGHRVQRVPVTESGGRIHTSAATVAVMPEIDEVDFKLDMNDVRIDVFRSSGAGGQKVNKTSSAIRVTYIPTGLVVECQDERSQYKNKDRALQILRSKLYEQEVEKQNASVAAERKSQIGSGDRSERVRTYNFPQNRVTDHRLNGEDKNFNLSAVINGELDPVIDALITADRAEKLRIQAEV